MAAGRRPAAEVCRTALVKRQAGDPRGAQPPLSGSPCQERQSDAPCKQATNSDTGWTWPPQRPPGRDMALVSNPGSTFARRMFIAMVLIGATASVASAQWTVVNLHPAGADVSQAYGVSDGQQVGYAAFDAGGHAGLWSGTAASWVDLHPVSQAFSYLNAAGGGQQVGYSGIVGTEAHAALWTGSAASWVDLNPIVASSSVARGVSAGQQVGSARLGSSSRASLWTGTAESWVDLTPAGLTTSIAYGVRNGQQAGSAVVSGWNHASLWSGSAASWVDLNPSGATQSEAFGIDVGQQVGIADVGGVTRASLWSGTAASWVDLNPAFATQSVAFGVDGGNQVGQFNVGGAWHASIWSGTADSCVDLSLFLPADFTYSIAQGVWHDGTSTYVVGTASRTNGRVEAMMWVQTVPTPSGLLTLGTGLVLATRRRRGCAR